MYRLIFWALLFMTSSANAAWLHLCPASQPSPSSPSTLVTRADGTQARLVAGNRENLEGCRGLPVQVQLEQIEALYPVPPSAKPEEFILLQGTGQESRFAISGASFPPAKAPPSPAMPMPLHANLLTSMQARPFGAEERVSVRLDKGRLELTCHAGAKAAGALLTAPLYIPRANINLQAAFSGTGNFELQVADAEHAAKESALNMGSLSAQTQPQTARHAIPHKIERNRWQRFVIVCPPQNASLRIDTLQLVGEAAAAARMPPRSAWVWQPPAWLNESQSLLDWARRHGLDELFIAVPMKNGAILDPAALAAFVRQAGASGIAVWSVDGDPHMVLPSEQQSTVQRARAYAQYNARAEPSSRLRGVQFDIEPYLLPGYETAAAEWDRRYLELTRALRQATRPMQLEFVVPYWWAGKAELLKALAPSADSLAVMDYRTDAQEIYRFAVPFLDWANRYGKRTRIALEAGPIAPETQRRYVRAARDAPGELQLIRMEGLSVLVLLKDAAKLPDAQAYRLQGSTVLDGSATTFHAAPDKMLRMLPELERDFSAWREFAGMALHELPGQTAATPK